MTLPISFLSLSEYEIPMHSTNMCCWCCGLEQPSREALWGSDGVSALNPDIFVVRSTFVVTVAPLSRNFGTHPRDSILLLLGVLFPDA